jgi:hypothetical protein
MITSTNTITNMTMLMTTSIPTARNATPMGIAIVMLTAITTITNMTITTRNRITGTSTQESTAPMITSMSVTKKRPMITGIDPGARCGADLKEGPPLKAPGGGAVMP